MAGQTLEYMYKRIAIILILILYNTYVNGQVRLILDHTKKVHKKKVVDLDREYEIVTLDTTYYFSRIVAFTDSTISVKPIYSKDTTTILFSKVQIIKKDWFKNRKWVEPFGWIAIVIPVSIFLLPIAAIEDGSKGVKEWALFEAALIGICGPPMFIGTRKAKYNLNTKWLLKTEK